MSKIKDRIDTTFRNRNGKVVRKEKKKMKTYKGYELIKAIAYGITKPDLSTAEKLYDYLVSNLQST